MIIYIYLQILISILQIPNMNMIMKTKILNKENTNVKKERMIYEYG